MRQEPCATLYRCYDKFMDTYLKMIAVSAILLAGCGGSAFSPETVPADDSSAKTDGDDAGVQVATDAVTSDATDAGAKEASSPDVGTDATPEAAPREDAAPEAATPTCTCGDAGTSCFYSVSEPPSGYGVPYPVTTLVLTPGAPSGTFTASVTAVPMPYHNVVWYDIDLGDFTNGGTIYIQGQVGDG